MVRENLKLLKKYHGGTSHGTIGLYSRHPVPRKTSRGATAGRYNSNYLLWFDPPLRADPKTSFYLLLSVFFDLLPMVTIGRTI